MNFSQIESSGNQSMDEEKQYSTISFPTIRRIIKKYGNSNDSGQVLKMGQKYLQLVMQKIKYFQKRDTFREGLDNVVNQIILNLYRHREEKEGLFEVILSSIGFMFIYNDFSSFQGFENDLCSLKLQKSKYNQQFSYTELQIQQYEDQTDKGAQKISFNNAQIQLYRRNALTSKLQKKLQSSSSTSILLEQIKHYLQTLNSPKKQVNLFCQHHSLPYPQFIKFEGEKGNYLTKCVLEFRCKYLNNSYVCFEGIGFHKNLKISLNEAAYVTLKSIFMEIPDMWKQFLIIKNKKGIKN